MYSTIKFVTLCSTLVGVASAMFDFNSCGLSKTCLKSPSACSSADDCTLAVSFANISSTILQIELFGSGFATEQNMYVAAGFADKCTGTAYMANTFVTECSAIGPEIQPSMKLSYNDATPKNVRIQDEPAFRTQIIQTDNVQYLNKMVYCMGRQTVSGFNVNSAQILNLDKSNGGHYYVVAAKGATDANGLKKHDQSVLSDFSYDLMGDPSKNQFERPKCDDNKNDDSASGTIATLFVATVAVLRIFNML